MTKLLTVLVFLATAAQAEELRFDVIGIASTNTNPSLRPFEASFAFDSSLVSYTGVCSSDYQTSAVVLTNVNVLLNGQATFTAPSLAADLNHTGPCPGAFFLGIDFYSAGNNFFWSTDPPGPPSGADPIADAFLGLHVPGNGAWITPTEQVNLTFDRISVQPISDPEPESVPEPGTLALMLLGGGLLWYASKTRRGRCSLN
jgi:hypothetical protein